MPQGFSYSMGAAVPVVYATAWNILFGIPSSLPLSHSFALSLSLSPSPTFSLPISLSLPLPLSPSLSLPLSSSVGQFFLQDTGRIRSGDRVMIHSCAGGVGQVRTVTSICHQLLYSLSAYRCAWRSSAL